jgi:hypothetical protein
MSAKKLLTVGALLFFALSVKLSAQEKLPLKLIATTLPGFTGDFDHFGLDLKGKRLFLAAEDHKTGGEIGVPGSKSLRQQKSRAHRPAFFVVHGSRD